MMAQSGREMYIGLTCRQWRTLSDLISFRPLELRSECRARGNIGVKVVPLDAHVTHTQNQRLSLFLNFKAPVLCHCRPPVALGHVTDVFSR